MAQRPDNNNKLAHWLALVRTPHLGPQGVQRLLERCGNPIAIFDAAARPGELPERVRTALTRFDRSGVDQDLRWAEQPAHHLITLDDARYPALLKELKDPPPVLFVQGEPACLSHPQVAVVGSRNPSPAGLDNARAFSRELARQGLAITSGLAVGIDGAAHAGALAGGGITLAVIGTGPDRIYPSAHRELAEAIARQGALVSEFPLGTPPRPAHFPRRNRLISGLSLGTLVVEASPQSGSLITARLAAEQGRDVFAIPGSIHNPLARGCHALIRQGAKLIESAEDIVGELGSIAQFVRNAAAAAPRSDAAQAAAIPHQDLLDCMGYEPVPLDLVVERSGLTAERVSSILLELELHGLVAAAPGGFYSRLEPETSK
ncbi:MAG TPA: DNA-protecting protein DprA [Gammaproteobacteria bacterium]|nr:DNA-protecting protein DprA [Gammaproteobacteria bacterium]